MCNAKFLDFNYIFQPETQITLESGTIDGFYPLENLKDFRTTKVVRSQTGTNTFSIIIDTITTEEIDTFASVGSITEGMGFDTVKIEAADSALFAPVEYDSGVLVPNDEFGMIYHNFPVESHRFWRITVTSVADYVELGKTILGKSKYLENNNVTFGWTLQENSLTKISKNRYGQRFADIRNTQKKIRASIRTMNVDEFEMIDDIFNYVQTHLPFFFILDDTETISNDLERFAMYCYLTSKPSFTNSNFRIYDVSFNLEQAT